MTPNSGARGGYVLDDEADSQLVHKKVLNQLLHPRSWEPATDRGFILDVAEIDALCAAAEEKFRDEPTVLRLRAPTKIFGDLHGQFGDLMRLFAEYGSPSTAGDIAYIDYLFLGDYVDRGAFSLETMSLLLALKVERTRITSTFSAGTTRRRISTRCSGSGSSASSAWARRRACRRGTGSTPCSSGCRSPLSSRIASRACTEESGEASRTSRSSRSCSDR